MDVFKRFTRWIGLLLQNKDDIEKAISGFTKATGDLKRIKKNMEVQQKEHDAEIIRLEEQKILKKQKMETADNIIKGIDKLLNNKF